MDKNVLKKFAIESRKELVEKITNKINRYFVDEDFSVNQNGEVYVLTNEKHTLRLTKSEFDNRQLLIKRIKEITIEQVIEESAYTWFNRIIAIRYMEIHDYLPLTKDNKSLGFRVLSSKDNTPDPEIMKISNLINPDLDIEFNKEYYGSIQDNNKRFEYILLLICKKLGRVIPQVFDGVTDYIDILIPDNMLNESGYITKLLYDVSVENFEKVEIIGWLYQYYNQTEKDKVISAKKAYKKNEIPFATQLFTPDWIVKYMVENSLGKYWAENSDIEQSEIKKITDTWKYYIESNKSDKININPTDITFFDPCCGSGHILVYAFELLYSIYLSAGYNKNEIAENILKYNLYGLDIDDRAGQLSVLSVILKAREYDKNIFNKNIIENMNIMSIQETNYHEKHILDYFNRTEVFDEIKYIVETFKNAKEIGSLLFVEEKDYKKINDIIENDNTIFGVEISKIMNAIIKQAIILSKKYKVVVTNPPYMNLTSMSDTLKKYITNNFETLKYDLFSAFIKRNCAFGEIDSYLSFMTPYVWMFISSYQSLREYLLNNCTITSLTQLEYNSFESACVPVCMFSLLNKKINNYMGDYIQLSDFKGIDIQEPKTYYAIHNKNCNYRYKTSQDNFLKIPGNTITYWVSDDFINNFTKYEPIVNKVQFKQGMATSDNVRFLRLWSEVDYNNIYRNATSLQTAQESGKKWFPYNKGGDFRKWYGNQNYVVNWKNDGEEMKEHTSKLPQGMNVRLKSRDFYFLPELSWSSVTTGPLSFRYYPSGFIFDTAGSCMFNVDNIGFYCGLMNSKIVDYTMKAVNPTINNTLEDMKKIPIIEDEQNNQIADLANENIKLAKEDWDMFEESMDFKKHPFIIFKGKNIKESYNNWKEHCNNSFNKVKKNEIEINKLLIKLYGLENELTEEVEDKDISIRKSDKEREVKSFISYFIGCVFGRYSLDKDGIIYAGGNFDKKDYVSFEADEDNIIPITDDAYFYDDVVEKFKKFVSIVYGKENVNENIDFVAETLGKKGSETSEERIRRYFFNEFFYDHCNCYSVTGSGRRPIYWLFDSGKKNGFKCLIYMHRYDETLVAKIRLNYLHRLQNSYEKELKDITDRLNSDIDLTSKRELSKRQADLSSKLQETNEYDEKIAHIAEQKIKIDLDDGVIVNYAKFSVKNPKTGKDESILAKIK